MSITSARIQVVPAATDNATFYLSAQPVNNALTGTQHALTGLTFNPSSNTLSLTGGVTLSNPASSNTGTIFFNPTSNTIDFLFR
jgi:hypothetical protein